LSDLQNLRRVAITNIPNKAIHGIEIPPVLSSNPVKTFLTITTMTDCLSTRTSKILTSQTGHASNDAKTDASDGERKAADPTR